MAATRTQVYLTAEQRDRLDELAKRDGRSLASHIREALDQYLGDDAADPQAALDATFGAIKDLEVPSRDEWQRG
ncbi:MAG: CopG family transcriptional regulator [Gaiellaceae bacterium]